MKTTNIVMESISSRQIGENSTAMTIDEDSMVFLMDLLGRLYTRPALAVLREYLSNAHDAHTAKSGELPPIEITLPEGPSQLLTIRDYGNGVSEEQFGTILSRYGNSTKRDSNEFIGGFGLGAKAGFALNDEFFMTSYQNGKGLRARFFKDSQSQGYVEIVERFQTREPDGMLVEVKIPKGNLDEFSAGNLTTLLMAYHPEAIQVTPQHRKGKFSLLSPSDFSELSFNGNTVGWMGHQAHKNASDFYAVVGKVVYGLNCDDIFEGGETELDGDDFAYFIKYSSYAHVINLPIGSVDLPSSREEITLSERSLKTLRRTLENYTRLLHDHIQNEINKGSYWDALIRAASLEEEQYPNIGALTWRGNNLGLSLLRKTKTIVHDMKKGRVFSDNITTVSHMPGTDTFINLVSGHGVKTFLVVAETEAEIKEISSILTASVVRLILIKECPDHKSKAKGAAFLILTKEDPLYEAVSHFSVLERPALITGKEESEKLRLKMKQATENQRLKELAERKAKAERTLTTFKTSSLREGHELGFLAYADIDEVFALENESELKYYWSEEELLALNENILPAFPYKLEEKGYQALRDTDRSSRNYGDDCHWKFRSFINLFLAPESRVIVLGKTVNLAGFKELHPEVESGVALVTKEIKAQLKDETSDINILRGTMIDNYGIGTRVPSQIAEFNDQLFTSQRKTLHPNFLETINSLARISCIQKKKGSINEHYLNELLPLFSGSNIPPTPDVWGKYETLEKQYPLLFFGDDFYGDDVIADLIEYINAKNA